jgi:hypothetical protein
MTTEPSLRCKVTRGLVIDGMTGQICDKATRTEVSKLRRKSLSSLQDQIWASKDLAVLAKKCLPAKDS